LRQNVHIYIYIYKTKHGGIPISMTCSSYKAPRPTICSWTGHARERAAQKTQKRTCSPSEILDLEWGSNDLAWVRTQRRNTRLSRKESTAQHKFWNIKEKIEFAISMTSLNSRPSSYYFLLWTWREAPLWVYIYIYIYMCVCVLFSKEKEIGGREWRLCP
jgi:hypothetical protein